MGIAHKITRLYGAKGWAAIAAFMLVVLVVFPLLNLVVPKDSVFYLSDYFVALAGKQQFPFLLDPNTSVKMFESQAIERYLDQTYGKQ